MTSMDVVNRGEVVGTLSDAVPDMLYLEGRFTQTDTPAGSRFTLAATSLDPASAMADPAKAIRTLIRESPDDEGTTFLVLSLSGGKLFGRRVLDREAVEWAQANVPE